jgi:hypothetical protein
MSANVALRTVVPLVCPDLSVCPTRMTVLKAFGSPVLAEELKAFATHQRPV